MSRPIYSARDQYSNLDRQDRRTDLQDDQMDRSSDDSEYHQTMFDLFQDGIEEFRTLPKCLKSIFITLAKKHAALKCRLLNNKSQIALLENAITSGELPRSIRFQIKSFEKRYSDVETISNLSIKVIESEKTRLTQQNTETTLQLLNGQKELQQLLKPIIENSDTFSHMLSNTELILNSLIEQEYCTMLLKMEHDKKVKEAKKAKFEKQKELNNAPALITSKHVKTMTAQIQSLKKELGKLTTKSKNGKGKPAMKKSDKPNQTKGGKHTNTKKRNGNSKNTRKDRQ